MATCWGIAGPGKVAHDFVTALGTLPTGEHTVVGVASYDLSEAQNFAKGHDVAKVYNCFEELASDEEIEIVYIGTVSLYHHKVAELMLNKGKHVLCEKPLTMTLEQTTELINLAKRKSLFLMEGIWSRSFPIYDWIKEEIESKSLGDVKQVIVSLGIEWTGNDGLSKRTFSGGTVLHYGVYAIQFASFVFNGEKPISVDASGHLGSDGIDDSTSVTLLYKEGRTATMLTHCQVALPNEAVIVGTKGAMRIPQFWCPTQIVLPSGNVKSLTLPKSVIPFNYPNSAALGFEAAEVRKCLKAGLKESPRVTHRDSLLIAEIQAAIRKQIGCISPEILLQRSMVL